MISTALMLLANTLLFSLRLERGSSFPRPLSAAEERECLDRLAQGDPEARNTLIEHNLRLVAHIVKKYYAQSADQDDLISIGTIGLIKGISSFMKDGICAIRSAMDELEEHKYLKRRKLRDEKGRFFGVEYTVYELPYTMLEGEQTEYKLAAKKEKAVSSAAPSCHSLLSAHNPQAPFSTHPRLFSQGSFQYQVPQTVPVSFCSPFR